MSFTRFEFFSTHQLSLGWSGGGMVMGKRPILGPLTDLDNSKARAIVLGVGVGGVVWTFFSLICHFSPFFPSLGEGPI